MSMQRCGEPPSGGRNEDSSFSQGHIIVIHCGVWGSFQRLSAVCQCGEFYSFVSRHFDLRRKVEGSSHMAINDMHKQSSTNVKYHVHDVKL